MKRSREAAGWGRFLAPALAVAVGMGLGVGPVAADPDPDTDPDAAAEALPLRLLGRAECGCPTLVLEGLPAVADGTAVQAVLELDDVPLPSGRRVVRVERGRFRAVFSFGKAELLPGVYRARVQVGQGTGPGSSGSTTLRVGSPEDEWAAKQAFDDWLRLQAGDLADLLRELAAVGQADASEPTPREWDRRFLALRAEVERVAACGRYAGLYRAGCVQELLGDLGQVETLEAARLGGEPDEAARRQRGEWLRRAAERLQRPPGEALTTCASARAHLVRWLDAARALAREVEARPALAEGAPGAAGEDLSARLAALERADLAPVERVTGFERFGCIRPAALQGLRAGVAAVRAGTAPAGVAWEAGMQALGDIVRMVAADREAAHARVHRAVDDLEAAAAAGGHGGGGGGGGGGGDGTEVRPLAGGATVGETAADPAVAFHYPEFAVRAFAADECLRELERLRASVGSDAAAERRAERRAFLERTRATLLARLRALADETP